MTDKDTARLVDRLIHSWDGDLQELFSLVEMVGRIRKRALMEQQARLLAAERSIAIYQDMILKIMSHTGPHTVEDIYDVIRAAHLEVLGEQ